jgi:hypothetical protein
MPIRSLNGLEGTNVYVNTISNGEATEVEQVGNTTETKINLNFKSNTAETTSLNSNDLVLIADNSTGKIVKYITSDNFLANAVNEWTLNSGNLYPNLTSTDVLIGTATNSSNHKFLVNGNAKITSDLTLDSNIIKGGNTITLPSSAGTLALTSDIPTNNNQLTNGAGYITASSSDTLTNKILTSPELITPKILDGGTGIGQNYFYNIIPSQLTNDRNITLPVLSSNDEFVFKDATQTLTNKSISYSQLTGTPTVPTNNNQLTNGAGYITASSTDTLTNKTLGDADFTGLTEFDTGNTTFIPYGSNGKFLIGNGTAGVRKPKISGMVTDTNSMGLLIQGANNNTNSGADMVFEIRQNSGSFGSDYSTTTNSGFQWDRYLTTLMTLTRDGKLGINTTSPSEKLEVNGSSKITGELDVAKITITGDSGESLVVLSQSASAVVGSQGRSIVGRDSNTGRMYLGNLVDNSDLISPITFAKKISMSGVLSNGTYDYTLPSATGTLALTSNIPTNNNQLTNGAGYITASSTDILSNKTLDDVNFTGITNFDGSTRIELAVGDNIQYNQNGKIQFANNSGVGVAPVLIGIVTDNNRPPLQLIGAGSDTNSGPDLFFDVRKSSGTDFGSSSRTGSGFEWARFGNALMRLTRDGKLGINTTSPSNLLHVVGTAQITSDLTLGGNIIKGGNTINLPSSAGTLALTNNAAFTGITNFDGSTRITLDVGDGFDFTANGTIQFGNNSGIGKSPTMMGIVSDANRAAIQLIAGTNNSNNAADFTFNVRESDGTDYSTTTGSGFSWARYATPLMRLTRDAKLGIFVTAPSERLEVNGNIKTTGILTTNILSNNITFSPSGTSNNWYPTLFFDGNAQPFGSTIGGGAINNGGSFRNYCWAVESTSGSFRGLGLFTNNTDSYSFTNGANYTWMGFFTPFSKNTAYSFTASHRCYSDNNDLYNEDNIGLIVVSTGKYDSLYIDNIDVDNAVPMVELSSKKKMKNVLGVIGKFEKDEDKRENMNFGYIQVCDKDKNRLYINSIGEGAIWVINTNGNFENGDYIQTSDISGYGEKQDDDILHNYSVAKITMDVDFTNIPSGFKTKTLDGGVIGIMVGCIYQQG